MRETLRFRAGSKHVQITPEEQEQRELILKLLSYELEHLLRPSVFERRLAHLSTETGIPVENIKAILKAALTEFSKTHLSSHAAIRLIQ